MAKAKAKKVKVTLVRSLIGRKPNQRKTAKALGLKKINSTVEKELNPAVQGMLNTVAHLVKIEEIG
ncbi:MAG: 50S ribosomal protein L30 [Spirochaetales bacterium]|nr:50S ribosomal protein L30 [Spirochaetales bacterium]